MRAVFFCVQTRSYSSSCLSFTTLFEEMGSYPMNRVSFTIRTEKAMKKVLVALLLLVPTLTWAEKPAANPADYTVSVHVQSSRLITQCGMVSGGSNLCFQGQQFQVLIDGKKFELQGNFGFGKKAPKLLRVGDYKAKVVKEDTSLAYEYSRTYEFLFPDGKTAQYLVTYETE